MSALTRHEDQAARRLTAQRVRAAGRSRRADAGTVTEIARSLLRDARQADGAEARRRPGPPEWVGIAVRDERAGARKRLTPGAFAAPRA
jgi:hypothetical protein